jgi:SEC-C motif
MWRRPAELNTRNASLLGSRSLTTMAKPGRNDPCPCGSGNKYKKCCLAKEEAVEREQLAKAEARRAESAAAHRLQLGEVSAAIAARLSGAEDADDELTIASNAAAGLVRAGKLDEAEQAARDLLVLFPDADDGYDRPSGAVPSTARERASSGAGAARLDQTVKASISTLPRFWLAHWPSPSRRRPERRARRAKARPGETDRADHSEAGEGDEPGDDLRSPRPFAQKEPRQRDGEKRLRLDDERGEPDREACVNRREQETELSDAEQEVVKRDLPGRRLGRSDEHYGGRRGEDEPERREHQRRGLRHADLDGDEGQAPDDCDADGDANVAGAHATYPWINHSVRREDGRLHAKARRR